MKCKLWLIYVTTMCNWLIYVTTMRNKRVYNLC